MIRRVRSVLAGVAARVRRFPYPAPPGDGSDPLALKREFDRGFLAGRQEGFQAGMAKAKRSDLEYKQLADAYQKLRELLWFELTATREVGQADREKGNGQVGA